MKVLVAIPVMGSYEIGRISLYQWDHITSPDCTFLLIDNSGHQTQYQQLFDRCFLRTGRWMHHRNDTNVGLVESCQQAYNFALGMEADILVLTHNDVWLYPEHIGEHDFGGKGWWDEELATLFEHTFLTRELGIVGLFGSKGCGSEGHRLDTFGSLIEIAGHGRQMTEWIEPAVCLDGFFLACNMKMLREATYECPKCHGWAKGIDDGPTSVERWVCDACRGTGKQVGGFDQRYEMHHVYDYDIALISIELGYRNAVLNIPCHHLSGLTANNAAFATSGPDIHTANYQRWLTKWQSKLGLTVDSEWNYTWGQR
jgi:hypothetical protein